MVTKVNGNSSNVKIGDNRMKDEFITSPNGMNIPRMRRPAEHHPNSALMMEVWASVASWFLTPEGNNPLSLTSCASSIANRPGNNCRLSADLQPLPLAPTICTAIRCTVPTCTCECFTPGKLHIRYCEACTHGWVPHALDKLGFRHIFGQSPVEPVQANVAFDIASLVLYGCQALPIRLKILLDRLFSVLQKEEVTQILRGFGWTQEDYARGYILQESHGGVLDRWNICSPEEEPLVLQQFLRFGETRTITQQLLLHGLGDLRHLPPVDNEYKKIIDKSNHKSYSTKHEERSKPAHITQNFSQKRHDSTIPGPLVTSSQAPSKFQSPLPPVQNSIPISPQYKQQHPINFVKLPPTGLTCIPITTSGQLSLESPTTSSPLNKLQNMQPFDFRKISSGAFSSTKTNSESRRHSETSDTSPSGLKMSIPSPSPLLAPPSLPVTSSITSNYSSGQNQKSPSTEFTSLTGSSEFGSEDGDDEEETSSNILNLSKDSPSTKHTRQRHSHSRKASTPMKRQWGSSNLPLNLGTQLINPATGKKRVQCNVCLKTFCDKGALKIHFSAVHLREMHKCTVEGCNMMFSSRRSRNRHSANPNPKLHSPHLRRKISPHDGRSAQAHPILIPPLQGGLNPLAFGPFPLLSAPPDLRQQFSGIDLKHDSEYAKHMENMKNSELCDNKDYYIMDEEDEEGIVVDGGADDYDDESYSECNSADKQDNPSRVKRIKISRSDSEDGNSNTDSNDESIVLSDSHHIKEENDTTCAKNVHKRKSQNPTKCAIRTTTDDETAHSDEDISDELMMFPSTISQNFHKSEQQYELDLSKNVKQEEKTPDQSEDDTKPLNDSDEQMDLSKRKSPEQEADKQDDEPINYTVDGNRSPARSNESFEYSEGYDSEENSMDALDDLDVPLDKDNPRKCTACGKVFQNHFGVKTHFQNVHLKLMHKCVVEGCNAAFPSKRSRDRHSSNLNLHRKLLSTSDVTPEGQAFNANQMHSDFLSRLYSEGQGLPSNTTNGDAISNHPPIAFPPYGAIPNFPGINPFNPRFPLLNGRSSSESPTSTSKSPTSFLYNIEEDLPTASQDNVFHCRFCSKPFTELHVLKEHYERYHLNEMFRCKVPGCMQVFSSRTKRNAHSVNRLLHTKDPTNS